MIMMKYESFQKTYNILIMKRNQEGNERQLVNGEIEHMSRMTVMTHVMAILYIYQMLQSKFSCPMYVILYCI